MTDRRELPADLRSLGAAYNRSRWERALADQLHAAGLPPYERELEFAKAAMGRRWRFDFAWPAAKLAVEVQGAVWTSGRHSRGAGYTADCEKFAHAAILGWRVMPVTPNQIRRGEALAWIAAALDSERVGVQGATNGGGGATPHAGGSRSSVLGAIDAKLALRRKVVG